MPTATYTGVIQAPPEEVFAFVADAENNRVWHEHVRQTRWIDDGPTRLGRRARQLGHLWGRDWAFVAEVAEWDPPQRVAFQVIEGYRVRTSIIVEPADGGASRVTLTVRTPRLPGPGVDAFASRLMKLVTRDRENGDFRRSGTPSSGRLVADCRPRFGQPQREDPGRGVGVLESVPRRYSSLTVDMLGRSREDLRTPA